MTNPTEPSPSRTSARIGERKKRAASALEAEQAAGAAAFAVGGGSHTGSSSNVAVGSHTGSSSKKTRPKEPRKDRVVSGLTLEECKSVRETIQGGIRNSTKIGDNPRIQDIERYYSIPIVVDGEKFIFDIPLEYQLLYKNRPILPTNHPYHDAILTGYCLKRLETGVKQLIGTKAIRKHVKILQDDVSQYIAVGKYRMAQFDFESVVRSFRDGILDNNNDEPNGCALSKKVSLSILDRLDEQSKINKLTISEFKNFGRRMDGQDQRMDRQDVRMDRQDQRIVGVENDVKDLQDAHANMLERFQLLSPLKWNEDLAKPTPQTVRDSWEGNDSRPSRSFVSNSNVAPTILFPDSFTEAAVSSAGMALPPLPEDQEAAAGLVSLSGKEPSERTKKGY